MAATLGFVAGLALADALDAVVPDRRMSHCRRWRRTSGQGRPFRTQVAERRAGSTARSLPASCSKAALLPGDRVAVAIGIGVNVVAHPEDVPYPAASPEGAGLRRCDAESLFLALSDAWAENIRVWDGGAGLTAIRQRWLARAAGLGGEVAVRVDGDVVRGVFETIDEDCRFVIRAGDGVVKIAAGDVHFGAVASASAA